MNPYRTCAEASRIQLEQRVEEIVQVVRDSKTFCVKEKNLARLGKQKLTPEIVSLLLDLGYSQRNLENEDYQDAKTRLFSRQGDQIEILVETNLSDDYLRYDCSRERLREDLGYLTYFKQDLEQLERTVENIRRVLPGKIISRTNITKRILQPFCGFTVLLPLYLGIRYSTGGDLDLGLACCAASSLSYFGLGSLLCGEDSITGFMKAMAQERIKPLEKFYGQNALRHTLTLPKGESK